MVQVPRKHCLNQDCEYNDRKDLVCRYYFGCIMEPITVTLGGDKGGNTSKEAST
jgi:hypothetical protein